MCLRIWVGDITHYHWAKAPDNGHIPILSAVAEYKALLGVSNPPERLAPRPRLFSSDPDAGLSVGLVGLVGGHLPRTSLAIARYKMGQDPARVPDTRTAAWESAYSSE